MSTDPPPKQPESEGNAFPEKEQGQSGNKQASGKNKHRNNKNKQQRKPPLEEAKSFFKDTYEQLLLIETFEEQEAPLSLDTMNTIMNQLSKFVKVNGYDITMSQLRKIFPLINQVTDIKDAHQLILARPKLAYIAARQNKPRAKVIIALIEDLIQQTSTNRHLKSLHAIMEGIISYFKAHHPKQAKS